MKRERYATLMSVEEVATLQPGDAVVVMLQRKCATQIAKNCESPFAISQVDHRTFSFFWIVIQVDAKKRWLTYVSRGAYGDGRINVRVSSIDIDEFFSFSRDLNDHDNYRRLNHMVVWPITVT